MMGANDKMLQDTCRHLGSNVTDMIILNVYAHSTQTK